MTEKCDDGACEAINKENEDSGQLCYCFNLFRHHIRNEIRKSGKTTIPEFISAQIRADNCACEYKNPKRTCCLGDVLAAVKKISKEEGKT